MAVRIVETAFDPETEFAAFAGAPRGAGAFASFVGYCRPQTHGRPVEQLFIEQYAGFTAAEITRLAETVAQRCGVLDYLVIHRVGAIAPGEAIVAVAALSEHRDAAFDAVRLLMDYLKTDAPLWKRESGPDGARWIEASDLDLARRTRAGEQT